MTTWLHSYPVANREHPCEMCGRTISKGEKHMKGVGLDGTAWSWRECSHCEAFRDLRTEMPWEEEYSVESFADYEPTDWFGLLWKARWQHKWRHGNGDLCAIPKEIA